MRARPPAATAWLLPLLLGAAAHADPPALAERVARRIAVEVPGAQVHVLDADDLEVELPKLARVHANLDNVRRGCATASDCDAVIEAFVATMKDGSAVFAVPAVERLKVRVSGREFLDQVAGQLKRAPAALQPKLKPVSRELAPGLWVTLVADTGQSLVLLQRGAADKLGKSDDELFALATQNLRAALPPPRFQATVTSPRLLIQAATTDGFDSAYLLLPDLLAAATQALGPEVVLAVPARDTLLAAKASDAAELKKAAGQLFAHGSYPVSKALFTLGPKGVAPYPAP